MLKYDSDESNMVNIWDFSKLYWEKLKKLSKFWIISKFPFWELELYGTLTKNGNL